MPVEGITHVNRQSFDINASDGWYFFRFIAEPPKGWAVKLNWWSVVTEAVSGWYNVREMLAIAEGNMPAGGVFGAALRKESFVIDGNSHTDIDLEGIPWLDFRPPVGSSDQVVDGVGTNVGNVVNPNAMRNYNGGIMSAYPIFLCINTDGGTKHVFTSMGFEYVKIGDKAWFWMREHSPNDSLTRPLTT